MFKQIKNIFFCKYPLIMMMLAAQSWASGMFTTLLHHLTSVSILGPRTLIIKVLQVNLSPVLFDLWL